MNFPHGYKGAMILPAAGAKNPSSWEDVKCRKANGPASHKHALVVVEHHGRGNHRHVPVAMAGILTWLSRLLVFDARQLPEPDGRQTRRPWQACRTSALATYATLPEATWSWIDIVVETVTEDLLAAEAKLFSPKWKALALPGAASPSNASSFRSASIAKASRRQGRGWPALLHAGAPDPACRGSVRSVHSDVKQAEKAGRDHFVARQRPVRSRSDVIGFLGNPHPGRA